MEPIVAYQTSWLESTGVYGVQHNQAAEPNRHDPYELSFMHNENLWHEKCYAAKALGRWGDDQ